MSISERRVQSRFLCADLVSVVWRDLTENCDGDSRRTEAVLEDISALGACVQTDEAIPPGCEITLSIGESHFRGVVSYSVFRDYGQFVGIRFSDDTAWSADMVLPQHLTSLEELAFAGGTGMNEK